MCRCTLSKVKDLSIRNFFCNIHSCILLLLFVLFILIICFEKKIVIIIVWLQVSFELERLPSFIIISMMLPTVMLLIIGYSTLYIKPSLLQVRSSIQSYIHIEKKKLVFFLEI